MKRFFALFLLLIMTACCTAQNVRDDSAFEIISRITYQDETKTTRFLFGSGTAVESDATETIILTANHVVPQIEDADVGIILINMNSEMPALGTIKIRDEKFDLALIRIETPDLPTTRFISSPTFEEDLHASCFLQESSGVTLTGKFIGKTTGQNHPDWLLFSLNAREGASGAGILDEQNHLVSVVTNFVAFPNGFTCNAGPPTLSLIDFLAANLN